MNWELIRIGIDVLTVLMSILVIIVLYISYKSYKKVSQPISMVKELLSKPVEEEDDSGDLHEMEPSKQV